MDKIISLTQKFAILLCLFLIGLAITGCTQQSQPTSTPEIVVTSTPTTEAVLETINTISPWPLLLVNEQIQSPQRIGVNHSFTFTFNQPVDPESFQANFSFQPAVEGELFWEDDVTVIFTPVTALSLGTHYSAQIGKDVYAQTGLSLETPVVQNFITTSPLILTSQYPDDQTAGLDIHSPIWITYNQPIVETAGAESPIPFSIEPSIPGSGRWANVSTFIFYPSEELVSNTTYSIKFNSNIVSQYGTTYESLPASTTFTTQGPLVMNVEPEDLSILEPGQNIVISFNQEMDQASVIANLRLEDKEAKEITPDFIWNETSTELTILGEDYFLRGNTVLLILNPAAKTRTGVPLNESLRIQYATLPVFDIDILPASSIDVEPSGYAQLSFHSNVPLDPTQDFLGLIDVRNKTPGEFTAGLDDTGKNLTYTGFFIPGTFYSYSLSPDLRDKWGQTLGDTLFKRFATKSSPAAILINQHETPTSHLFFPLNDIQVPVETTNIRRVDMQSISLSVEEYIELFCDYSDCLQFNEFAFTRFWYQSVYPYIVNAPVPSELTMTPRFRTLDPGVYVFDFDSPDLKNRDSLRFFGVAANTQLTAKQIDDDLLIWAINLESFSPIKNAPVAIYNAKGEVIDGGTTDAYGLVKIKNVNPGTIHIAMYQPEHPQFGIISIVVNEQNPSGKSILTSIEFFLDRPTYHPGAVVNYLIYPNAELDENFPVNLVYTYQGQSTVIEENILFNTTGTGLQGSFRIPESLPLGSYTIELAEHDITHPIIVAETKTSETDIDITFSQTTYEFGEEIQGEFSIRVAGKIPVPGQTVNWVTSISPTNFTFSDYCITDDAGYCSFSLPPEILDSLSNQETYTLTITASSDVLTSSYSQSCLISPSKFNVTIQPETWLGQAGEAFGVEILSLDPNQEVLPSVDLDARFEKISFMNVPSFIEGKEIITREIQATQIASTAFSTDENGYARLTFTPPDTGVYRITVHKGNFAQEKWFYVNGIQPGEWLEEEQDLLTIADKETALPGETVQVFLPNPFSSTATVLVVMQNQSEYRHQIVTIDEASGKIIDLAIKESDIPMTRVSMTFVGLEADGRVGLRNSEIEISVEKELPKLSIESELEITTEGNALFKISVTDANDTPVQAAFSLLVLPKDWVSQQPATTVFFQEDLLPTFEMVSDNSLDKYIRRISWVPDQANTAVPNDLESLSLTSVPLTQTDTSFLTNLNTSVEGTSFIEFPFSPNNTEYAYYVVAVNAAGITGFHQAEITLPEEQEVFSRKDNFVTLSNVLTSPGQEVILLPISFENETQKWILELFGDDLTAILSFANRPAIYDMHPVSIASEMLKTYALNGLNSSNHSIAPYISLLESTQNEDGGWGYPPDDHSDNALTNFIAFTLVESGGLNAMEVENLDRLAEYLQNSIAAEVSPTILNRYSLQSLTLEYQELANIVGQYSSSSVSEQIFLILALAQQSDTENSKEEILATILSNALYDEFGAYFPGDKTEEIWHSDESITALILFTLGQIQPQSNLIPDLRHWLIHQGLNHNLTSNPVAHSLTLLALQRTAHIASTDGDYGIQVLINSEDPIQLMSSDLTSQPFVRTYEVGTFTPTIAIIHEEGQGNLYYRISAASPNNTAISNGIEFSQTFYPVGKYCRPGNCIPESKFTLSSEINLISAHLAFTVTEDLHHVILTWPESKEYLVHPTVEVFRKLSPPLASPLEYGLGLNAFTISQVDGKTQLYATTLPAGTYEIIYYIEPIIEGSITIEPINAYHLFSKTLYALTEPYSLEISLEKNNE